MLTPAGVLLKQNKLHFGYIQYHINIVETVESIRCIKCTNVPV